MLQDRVFACYDVFSFDFVPSTRHLIEIKVAAITKFREFFPQVCPNEVNNETNICGDQLTIIIFTVASGIMYHARSIDRETIGYRLGSI